MMKESPDLLPLRKKLRDLIKEYEDREWSDFDKLTDSKLTELENAEELVANEQQFVHQRKLTIRKRLKKYDLSQQDLGVILGHPKSYMSELSMVFHNSLLKTW